MKYQEFLHDRGYTFYLKSHLLGEKGHHWVKFDMEKKQFENYPIGYIYHRYSTWKMTKAKYCRLTKYYYFYFTLPNVGLIKMFQIPSLSKKNQWVYEYNIFHNCVGIKDYYLHKTYDLTNSQPTT